MDEKETGLKMSKISLVAYQYITLYKKTVLKQFFSSVSLQFNY